VTTDLLNRAFVSAQSVLANVDPSQLDAPTPCRSWTVRNLINHMIAAPRVGVSALQTGEAQPDDADYTTGDFVAAYRDTASAAKEAFAAPGVAERMVKLPFAEVPGAFLMTMVTTDQSTNLDPELASTLLAQAAIPDQFRGDDGKAPFGPIRPAPADATPADQLAAHLGREM
jgi:uncharacterized protein (TIGR03086 family)